MKILIVNKFLYPKGGAETYSLKIGEELKKKGHEVQYFGMYDPKNIVGNQAQIYTNPLDFRKKSIQQITYPFRIIYSKEAERKMGKVLDDFKPDIVHLNNIHFHLTTSIIQACKDRNIPVIWTLHDMQLLCPNHLCYNGKRCQKCLNGNYLYCIKNKCIHDSFMKSVVGTIEAHFKRKDLYKYVSVYICPSKFLFEKMQRTDFINRKIYLQNFIEKKEQKQVDKENYVLFFGRIAKEKGTEEMLYAFQELKEISFKMIGTGPEEEKFHSLKNVEMLGFKSGEELDDYIRKARFVLSASSCYENCPLTILESLQLGTPVITSDFGGMKELVRDGIDGYLVKNKYELKEKIELLYKNPIILPNDYHFQDLGSYCDKLIDIYQDYRG